MRRWIIILGLLAIMLVGVGSTTSMAFAQGEPGVQAQGNFVVHVVQRGETVSSIARRYNVSPNAIIAANNLPNPNLIYPGQRLIIPLGGPTPCQQTVYIVQRGDTLSSIGRRFGVPWQSIAAANHIPPPYTIYPGQRLLIPCGTPPPPPPPQSAITITSPAAYAVVRSPVTVTGRGRASFEQTLGLRVFDVSNRLVGQGSATVQGELGQVGPFRGTVAFTVPPGTQLGHIEVVDVSAADGSIIARATQPVWLQR
ncbi:MAG: LysM peptidoglycan-binding domain-containing protein [Anaerolineae bacterium]